MAGKVMRMPVHALPVKEEKLQRQPDEKFQKKEDEKIQNASLSEEKLQRRGDGVPAVGAGTQAAIQNKTTGGQPLSSDVRSFMEPRFGSFISADVRIHRDSESAGLNNQLSARAFTYQNHIFFSHDQYQPGTSEGKQLLAHELTHTIQQGHSVQRSMQLSTTTTSSRVQRAVLDSINPLEYLIGKALGFIADNAAAIPGFTMLTVVIGYNPITRAKVDRSAGNILRGAIEMIPGGAFITQALANYGCSTRPACSLHSSSPR